MTHVATIDVKKAGLLHLLNFQACIHVPLTRTNG